MASQVSDSFRFFCDVNLKVSNSGGKPQSPQRKLSFFLKELSDLCGKDIFVHHFSHILNFSLLFARHKKCYRVPHNYVNLRYKIDLQNNAKSLLMKRQAVELFYAGCTSFADRRYVV